MKKEYFPHFLNLLEVAKGQHNLSDRRLATALGLADNSYFVRWRKGKGSPSWDVHCHLARLLGTDMNGYARLLQGQPAAAAPIAAVRVECLARNLQVIAGELSAMATQQSA